MCNSNADTKFWIDYINQAEIQSTRPNRFGQKDQLYKKIYNSFNHFTTYEPSSSNKNHGAIFDLCFSKDGHLLVGGTKENALLLFDSLNHQLIKRLDDAHENSINRIRFLDSNLFATASNDTKIALWDQRNLKQKVKLLANGHTHFIRDLEYDSNLKYLISSGFDGSVIVWDINNNSSDHFDSMGFNRERSEDCPFKKVISLTCLMRMRMTHDFTKMIICTVEGYIMVIHDLDLTTLKEDLYDFQSDLYRLMQKKHSSGFDFGSWQNSLFRNQKNRVELISDFPVENEAHLIGSLDIHPQNWCILNRNLSRDENSEWTCVHDIQDYERPNEMMFIELPKTENIYFPHAMFKTNNTNRSSIDDEQNLSVENSTNNSPPTSNTTDDSNSNDQNNNQRINRDRSDRNPNDLHISPLIIISARSARRAHATLLNHNTSYRQLKPGTYPPPKIYRNLNRMTHYIEEFNTADKLFVKEPHFSSCGRFIASPHANGFRLLSFNSDCTELSDQILSSSFRRPQKLNELATFSNNTNFVTTVIFSPTHHQIASGCLNGLVSWYQPML